MLTIPATPDAIPICSSPHRAACKETCICDRDTGWARRQTWRWIDMDAPKLGARGAGCSAETAIGRRSQDRFSPWRNEHLGLGGGSGLRRLQRPLSLRGVSRTLTVERRRRKRYDAGQPVR